MHEIALDDLSESHEMGQILNLMQFKYYVCSLFLHIVLIWFQETKNIFCVIFQHFDGTDC